MTACYFNEYQSSHFFINLAIDFGSGALSSAMETSTAFDVASGWTARWWNHRSVVDRA